MWLVAMMMTAAFAWNDTDKASNWYVVNDTVMGGVSRSSVADAKDGGVTFSGILSLDNNGGFVSTRTEAVPETWGGIEAIKMTVRGDGRRYIATVRTQNRAMRRIYYRQSFDTIAGEATEITLPLRDFDAYTYGRRVPGAPALTDLTDQVGSFGVMLADKQPGSFAIEIMEIATLEGETPMAMETLEPASIEAVFSQAIEMGVPLYNGGRADRCGDVYETAITSILLLAPDQLSADQQNRLIRALRTAQRDDSASDRAWTLRRAIDATMLSMDSGS